MNFKPVFYVNGILILVLSAAMLGPCFVDLANGSDDWEVFLSSALITAFFGLALIFMNRQPKFHMSLRETFLLTCSSYVFMAAFGALPFTLSALNLGYADAFFEAMSGVTTTGSTVISGLDNLPHGILLWRAMLTWIGGIGFLIIALAVFPMLQISGMQIFKTQSFQIEKVMPSASQMATYICAVYAGLTLLCAIALHFAGMSDFDAICHAMATMSTGGFANYDASIGHFNSGAIDLIIVFFMILSSLPFVLYLRAGRGDADVIWKDSQVRTFFCILGIFTLSCAAWLFLEDDMGLLDSLRNGLFLVASYMTTTGFANNDYALWGHFIVGVAFMATFLGSCSGSTAGGIKIFRLQILFMMLRQQLQKLLMPHGLFQVRYNGKIVEPTLQAAVAGFFFVYIMSWLTLGVLLQLTGLDFTTAFSGAIAAVSNTGVGTGDVIGPAANFAALPNESIWVISLAMLFGRVEFLTLLVLLMPSFWRD
ncbi:MAG: TrkH family potassium uptake protein [Micavibrio sp.]|nr:TrkH family potassium uptake protein [Micavibrio sp.]